MKSIIMPDPRDVKLKRLERALRKARAERDRFAKDAREQWRRAYSWESLEFFEWQEVFRVQKVPDPIMVAARSAQMLNALCVLVPHADGVSLSIRIRRKP